MKHKTLVEKLLTKFCRTPEWVSIDLIYIEPTQGFTVVILHKVGQKKPLVGVSKCCNYAPMADKNNVETGITIALTRALRAGKLYRRNNVEEINK